MSNSSSEILSVREKIGYSLGDLSANLIFQTLMTFLAYFYTDIYRIPPKAAATIIFVVGLLGAFVFTPLVAVLADRTHTRWGKFRPWILWTAVPFGVLSLLAFSTPDLGPQGKVIYAAATYTLLVLVYAANNLPYSALSGVLTGNMGERNSLSAYRFVAVMVAQLVVQSLLLPLVMILGDGDRVQGFQNTMLLFAVVGTVFFLITFFTTRERVVPAAEQKSSLRQDLADLAANRPWLIMLLVTILVFTTLALKGGTYVYYFENYLQEPAMARFLESIGFYIVLGGINSALVGMGLAGFQLPEDATTSAFGLFNAGGIILMVVGIGFSRKLADRFGKRDVYGVFLVASTVFMLAFYVIPPDRIGLVFGAQILHGFFYGITIPLLWAMVADVADWSEWKNRRRATAIVFSAILIGLKLGLSIGGALVAGILAHYGYDPDLPAQAAQTVEGIKLSISLYASIPFLACIALLFFYEINKAMESRIEHDLAARRAGQPA